VSAGFFSRAKAEQGRQIVRRDGGTFPPGAVAGQAFAGDAGVAGAQQPILKMRGDLRQCSKPSACSRPPEPITEKFIGEDENYLAQRDQVALQTVRLGGDLRWCKSGEDWRKSAAKSGRALTAQGSFRQSDAAVARRISRQSALARTRLAGKGST